RLSPRSSLFPYTTLFRSGGGVLALDINRCTAGELVALPGIGPVLAERIIKYRNLLGGFVDKWQLVEVYGLDSSVARLAAEQLIRSEEHTSELQSRENLVC